MMMKNRNKKRREREREREFPGWLVRHMVGERESTVYKHFLCSMDDLT